MLSPQQIGRVVIVLKEGHLPIPLGMAAFALLGKVALMFVVLFVAGMAVSRSFLLIQVPFMAGLTLCHDVPAS